jgi:hypothetical protein
MSLTTLLIVLLVIFAIASLPSYPYSRTWGYYPVGGLGTILLIVLVLYLLGIIR